MRAVNAEFRGVPGGEDLTEIPENRVNSPLTRGSSPAGQAVRGRSPRPTREIMAPTAQSLVYWGPESMDDGKELNTREILKYSLQVYFKLTRHQGSPRLGRAPSNPHAVRCLRSQPEGPKQCDLYCGQEQGFCTLRMCLLC
ncbi:hypothetical protein GWK47_036185 [Chionoecetes opilio]|uniref:Uncharacterized protein n=1 Tax=Chionoecetes opilio TaxID=41210 RepID=A0A8J4YEM5_CHIOP|nr:hypothetical protein GWK47_036185 [Chionoecetes opilio]